MVAKIRLEIQFFMGVIQLLELQIQAILLVVLHTGCHLELTIETHLVYPI